MKPEEFYQRLQEVHGITLSDVQKKQFDQYFHLLVECLCKMVLLKFMPWMLVTIN